MSGRGQRQSVFKRLGTRPGDDTRLILDDKSGSPTRREFDSRSGRIPGSQRHVRIPEEGNTTSSRKRHHRELEDGEIDDDDDDDEEEKGMAVAKRHHYIHGVKCFDNTGTDHGKHSSKSKEREDQTKRRHSESIHRQQRPDTMQESRSEHFDKDHNRAYREIDRDRHWGEAQRWEGVDVKESRSSADPHSKSHSSESPRTPGPSDQSHGRLNHKKHRGTFKGIEPRNRISTARHSQLQTRTSTRQAGSLRANRAHHKDRPDTDIRSNWHSSASAQTPGSSYPLHGRENDKSMKTYKGKSKRIEPRNQISARRHNQLQTRTCPEQAGMQMSQRANRAHTEDVAGSSRADPREANRRGSLRSGLPRDTGHQRDRRVLNSQDQIRKQARRDLRQLTLQDTGKDIAIWLASRPVCLKTVVEMDEMNTDEVGRLLRVLARACTDTTYLQDLIKLILPIVADSSFFRKHLTEWIMKIKFTAETETIVSDICTLCSSILQQFPKQAVHVGLLASLLYTNYHSQITMPESALTAEKLNEIRMLTNDCNVTLLENENPQKHREINKFRKISIIPDLDEIRIDVKPVLNPILKKGAFENVDTYLDTQFRLLREDFVAPLRAGICSFVTQQQGESSRKHVDDVRVYHKVHVLHPVCGSDGVSHCIKFDLRGWSSRQLASNKVLCYGSLVGLSADGFESIHFAVITSRDHLSEGIVDIQFQGPTTDGVYNREYIMAESAAFFEAYRHVLKALQKITDTTLPLQKHIIKASHSVSSPLYLRDAPDKNYNLLSLFKPYCAYQALYRLTKKHPQDDLNGPAYPTVSPMHTPTSAAFPLHLQSNPSCDPPYPFLPVRGFTMGNKPKHRTPEEKSESMIGEEEVTSSDETSTNSEMEKSVPRDTVIDEEVRDEKGEVPASDGISMSVEMEITAPCETSPVGEKKVVTASNETLSSMEITASGEASMIGEKEVAASTDTSSIIQDRILVLDKPTIGEKGIAVVEHGTSTNSVEKIIPGQTNREACACNKEENHQSTKTSNDSPSDPSRIPLLSFEKWPDENAVRLDESQRRAVYSALTQELAVIQGPPGTGKTYVGLKIMEILLDKDNREVWSGQENKGPVLVVCYTNHALDQFLEGVLAFEKSIVRIGGRSKSQRLERYNLKHLKHAKMLAVRNRRHNLIPEKSRLMGLRGMTESTIEEKVQEAYAFRKVIVGSERLKQFMIPRHIDSLHSRCRSNNSAAIISRWLELEPLMSDFSRSSVVHEAVHDHAATEEAVRDIEIDDERMLDDELDGASTSAPVFSTALMTCRNDEFVLEMLKKLAKREEDGPSKQNKLKALQSIEWQMKSTERMNQNEVNGVDDVWGLSIDDRWRIYRHWVDAYRTDCLASTAAPIVRYDDVTQAIKEIGNDEVCQMLRDVNVIGMTTTGAAKWQTVLQQVGPRIVVLEEAAEVMEAHVIATLSQHCQHLILIGDHQQLKPNPNVYRLAKQYHLDISLFERMVNNDFPCNTLARQHRMRPEIAAIMRKHFYKDLQDDVSVLHMEDVRGVTKNVFFINHGHIEDSRNDGMKSHSSRHEAEMTVALCNYLLQQGYSTSQVTILTVYTGQLLSIEKLLRDDSHFDGVRVSVVDNYQGEECDIILLSLVRSNDEGNIGFLKIDNRICVMLSRAKLGLFCIGNFEQLAAKSEKWKSITDDMRQKQLLDNSLVLACSVHPDTETKVACAADFKLVPEGGCKRPCEFRLPCGHVCTRSCHPYDRSHTYFICRKRCERAICEGNHKCPYLCWVNCPIFCNRPVTKQLPRCNHSAEMKCSNNPDYIGCVEKCGKKLPCGHTCRNTCGKPCSDKPCLEKVLRSDLPCGHQELMPCSDEAGQCPALCRKLLACGHKCPGKCSSCLGGRLHMSCRQKCGRILVCGHKCRSPCASNCPPCQEKCENRCIHSKCQQKCSEPCAPCQEPCGWQCRHNRCGKKCSEPCDRPPCDSPCSKVLPKCQHRCIGMCGEPCPSKCRVCNKEEVTEIFFGTEDEDGASFVELQDCGHIIEVSGLDQWMKQSDDSSSESADSSSRDTEADGPSTVAIQLKSCPKCKTPIRRSTRYGGVINKMLTDIERVKGQVLGDSDQIAQTKEEIRSTLLKIKESCLFAYPSVDAAINILESRAPSLYELNILLNQTNLANEAVKLVKQLGNEETDSPWLQKTKTDIRKVAGRLFNPSRPFRGTEQELIDFPNELQRLHLCIEECDILKTGGIQILQDGTGDLQNQMEKVKELLHGGKPLTTDSEKEAIELLQKLRKGIGGLDISKETKVMIIKAVGLSQGHWYKCPNGHVYAIGECGGAMQSGKCPDCQAEIGGARHQLASGNAVASEMDGAQFAAWSEQANLANYDL